MNNLLTYAFVFLSAASLGVQATKPEAFSRPSLQVRLNWLSPEYSDQHVKGAGMILRGEPLEIDVAVVNDADGPRAKVEQDWFNRVFLTLRSGRQFDEPPAPSIRLNCGQQPVVVEEQDVKEQADHLLLGREGRRWVRCRPNVDQLQLVPGRYTLRVEWGPAANLRSYPDRFRQAHPHMFEFEFRDTATDAEQIDLSIHMAHRALYDRKQPDEALEFINEALARQPASSTALVLLASIRAAQGDCREAAAGWRQAAQAIRSGSDANRRLAQLSAGAREGLAMKWQKQADSGRCEP